MKFLCCSPLCLLVIIASLLPVDESAKLTPKDIEKLNEDILVSHNSYRNRHCSPPLKLSSQLTEEAEKLLTDHTSMSMEHLIGQKYGVSLPLGVTKDSLGTIVMDIYDLQQKKFNFDSPQVSKDNDQFVRMVWSSTTELGVAIVEDVDEEEDFHVAFVYDPSHLDTDDVNTIQLNVARPTCIFRSGTANSFNGTLDHNNSTADTSSDNIEVYEGRGCVAFAVIHSVQIGMLLALLVLVGLSIWCYFSQYKTLHHIVAQTD